MRWGDVENLPRNPANVNACQKKTCMGAMLDFLATSCHEAWVLFIPAFQHRNAAEGGRISVRLESQAYTLDV